MILLTEFVLVCFLSTAPWLKGRTDMYIVRSVGQCQKMANDKNGMQFTKPLRPEELKMFCGEDNADCKDVRS